MSTINRNLLYLLTKIISYSNQINSVRPNTISHANILSIYLRIMNFHITILLQHIYSHDRSLTSKTKTTNLLRALFSISFCIYYNLIKLIFSDNNSSRNKALEKNKNH